MSGYRYAIGEYNTRDEAWADIRGKLAGGDIKLSQFPMIEAGSGAWPFVVTIEATVVSDPVEPYPNDVLTDIAKQLLDDYGLTLAQIRNLAADLHGECENINESRSEAYWTDRSAPDDSSYRRDIIAAGRGHLLR